jgi:peroxiredoxin
MRPLVAVVIVLSLVVAAAALGFLTGRPRHDADASSPATLRPEVSRAAPVPGTASPVVRARPGKVLPLAEAFKELDLVRPSRAKLAEDFTLPTLSGPFRLSEHRGKVVMVNFWATWCPPCLEEMPAMERLYRRLKDGAFTLVAVSVDADPKKVAPFVTGHKLTFPIALDPKMDLANGYAVRALPSSFIVGPDGNLAALAIGPRHWDGDAALSLIEGMAR